MSKEVKIMIGIAVVVFIGAAVLLFKQPATQDPSKPVDSQSLVREGSHMTKSADAKVTIVEFGDFQCPACAASAPTVEQIIEKYKDNKDVNFVFRNFPLSQHANAIPSAKAAEAAGAQGKYWEMYKLLYENQAAWETVSNPYSIFETYAQTLGLDMDKFKEEAQSNKYASVINADQNDGLALGVNATPTFFVNGEKQANTPTFEGFQALIEEKLK
jgi:protein-disulfide isomerase